MYKHTHTHSPSGHYPSAQKGRRAKKERERCCLPKSFPENFFLTTTKGKKLKLEYPCSVPLPSAVRLRSKEHRLQFSAQSEGVGSSVGAKVFTAVLLPRILRLARPVAAFFSRRGLELPRAPEVHQRAVPRGTWRTWRNLEGPLASGRDNRRTSMHKTCLCGVSPG